MIALDTQPQSKATVEGTVIAELRSAGMNYPGLRQCCFSRGISWQIHEGDFWVISGLHDSGKTSLTLLASGLLRPTSGNVILHDTDVVSGKDNDYRNAREKTGIVFEMGGRLFQQASIADNIALPLRYQGGHSESELAERVEALLNFSGLTGHAKDTPPMLSRNLQQRAGLARALSLSPSLLFLDNPTAGLDSREKTWWKETLHHLHQGHPVLNNEPVTLAVTTADLSQWKFEELKYGIITTDSFHTFENLEQLKRSDINGLNQLLHPSQT